MTSDLSGEISTYTEEGWPFDSSSLTINLAMGWLNGGEIDDTIFPASFEIDCVRVYEV